jgi:SAM-dependent methyltransferase
VNVAPRLPERTLVHVWLGRLRSLGHWEPKRLRESERDLQDPSGVRFVRAHFPPAPARVLDIAGGSGRFALPLLRDGYEVTVNDISPASLQLLETRCAHLPVRLLPGDFLTLDIPGGFDSVLAMECLEYLPLDLVLSRVRGLLKPGGLFIFTGLNSGSWRFVVRGLLGRAHAEEHVMKTREYRSACNKLGFEVLAMRGLMWTPFAVASNSPLVPVFANLERVLGLRAIHSQSPWILVAARSRP